MGWYEKYKCIKLLTTMTIMNVCYDWKKYEYVKVIKPKVWICIEVWTIKIVFNFIVKEWLIYVYDLITDTG
jgi:hypothetical protein